MNDFITLSCPTCGGHLKIDSNSREYTCEYCRQRHIVREEDIEYFGRCPICKRNDRVEKVSAIYKNRSDLSQLASRIKPPSEPVINVKSDICLVDSITLKRLILQEVEIIYPGDVTLPGLAVIIPSLVSLPLILILVIYSNYPGALLLIPFALIVGGIFLIIKRKKKYLPKVEENRKIMIKNEKLKHDWLLAANALHDKWKHAYKRWEQCYYCHRDDVVFIPGENNAVPASKLGKFLYQEIDL
jgi:hypothetical protein